MKKIHECLEIKLLIKQIERAIIESEMDSDFVLFSIERWIKGIIVRMVINLQKIILGLEIMDGVCVEYAQKIVQRNIYKEVSYL